MNYKIIFCLLFTLINTKKGFHPLFEKTMAINLLSESSNSDSLEETNGCKETESKDKCLAIINPQKDYQCCYLTTKTDFGNSETCSEYPKDIDTYQKLTKSSQFKATIKESYGYLAYMYDTTDIKYKLNINCNNGEMTISYGYDTYTENEKKILKNEEHCLNKHHLKEEDHEYDVGKCEEGLLLESSKSAGLECGYALFNIKINSERRLAYKTCDIFNLDLLSNIIKTEPRYFDEQVELIIRTQKFSSFESYKVELYDIEGNKMKYDSLTGKITIEPST